MMPPAPAAHLGHAFAAVHGDRIFGALEPVPIPKPLLEVNDLVRVVVRDIHCVRSLLVIVEKELAAHPGDLVGIAGAQGPPRDIDPVNAVVGDITASVVPVPVDGAVIAVPIEWHLGHRAGPDLVLDARRYGLILAMADVAPHLHVPDLG